MERSTRPGVLPLRPLTLGELLDAAVALLRQHAGLFLAAGAVLALAEQAVLLPARTSVAVAGPIYQPYRDRLGEYWLLLCAGLAIEAAVIALIGGLTAAAAGPALLGEPVRARELVRRARLGTVGLIALVAAVVAGGCALAALLPWFFGYGLMGLAVPAVVVDRVGPLRAIGRSLSLSSRHALRACAIRVVGYLGWLAIRVALGLGGTALIDFTVGIPAGYSGVVLVSAIWVGVNAVAYPTLACLDAVLHLETRMRAEGLDIAVGRALHRGLPAGATLAVPR